MKNISRSLVVIVGVAALAIGGTIAYFSDTETSTGNTFSTGTIDISVDDQNPWTKKFELKDMKPSETGILILISKIPETIRSMFGRPSKIFRPLMAQLVNQNVSMAEEHGIQMPNRAMSRPTIRINQISMIG